MKEKCKEDIIEMAQEIAEVRKTGVVNMYDRGGVINVLEVLGYDYTADYIKENKEDYIKLLKLSGDY